MAGKYKAEFCDQAQKLALLGHTNPELATFFGVSERTIDNWIAKNDEFGAAVKAGRVVADSNVAQSLYNRAMGFTKRQVKIFQYLGEPIVVPYDEYYPPDTTAALAWLNNRCRDKWQRNPDPSGGTADLPPTKVIFEVQDARTRENPQSEP